MKRFFLYIIILYGGLLLAGCRNETEPPAPSPTPTPQPRAEAERTVIVYMAADNTLSIAVREDTTEMAKGKDQIPEGANFIIYLDDKQHKPAIYELTRESGITLWKEYDEEMCSTNADVMLGVLKEIEQYFPARHYGITLWSHATGWAPERKSQRRKTFGQDKDNGATANEMEIPVLRSVLEQLPKFDYLFFDACFMQCIEVAYELRNVADFMVGSPAEIPGPGAPYHKIVGALCEGNPQGIIQGYASEYPLDNTPYTGVLLSCIDCSKLDALAEATGQFLTPFYMERKDPGTFGFQYYCTDLDKYTYQFDMHTIMWRLLSAAEQAENYTAWMEAFDQAVPLRTLSSTNQWYANTVSPPYASTAGQVKVQDPEHYGGVSMFVPLNAYNGYGWNEDFKNTSWYKAAGWEQTGW